MEKAKKINYSASTLGGWNCLDCGAHVNNVVTHNKFHDRINKLEELLKLQGDT